MSFDPLLSRAIRLARRGKFDAAVKLLEPEEPLYSRSYTFYYILGLSYLHLGIINRAFSYFKLAREVKMQEPTVLLALAAIFLRRGDTSRAVDFYLEIQDLEPRNRIARQGLRIIRSHSESIMSWLERGQLPRLYPPLPKIPFSPRRLLKPLAACLGTALAVFVILGRLGYLPPPFGPPPPRQMPTGTALEKADRDAPMQIDGSFRYILPQPEVLKLYDEARTLFVDHRDEAARVALNRILESNSPEMVKNKARLLESYLEIPEFGALRDRFSYGQVMQEPALYRNCHVIWRGMAANLAVEENSTSFEFLVGYDTKKVVEGIVPVRFDFAIPLNPERPVEVLARVIPVGGGETIHLEGVALNQAGLLGPPSP